MLPRAAFIAPPSPNVSHGWKGVIILYSLLLFYIAVYFSVLGLINSYTLVWQGDDGRVVEAFAPEIQLMTAAAAAAAAADNDVTSVSAAAFHALPSLPDAVQLFRALKHSTVVPTGEYVGVLLDVGPMWLAGSRIFKSLLLGYDGNGEAIGQVFEGTKGTTIFQQVIKGVKMDRKSYVRPFRVDYQHSSALDGGAGTLLDYSATDAAVLRGLVAEVRCVTAELCIGLAGFRLSNGVRNGVPYLLFRAHGGVGAAAAADGKVPPGQANWLGPRGHPGGAEL